MLLDETKAPLVAAIVLQTMNRATFLVRYYPDLRLTALPGGKVEIRDPQRREGLEVYVRAYEQEIWEDLLPVKSKTTDEK